MKGFSALEGNWAAAPFVGSFVQKNGEYHSVSDLKLISHITDNLYVGGCIGGTNIEDFFSHIFSLYKWERYVTAEHSVLHEYTMFDTRAEVMVTDENGNSLSIDDIAAEIVTALQEGGNVLIHCQAGINRSNLTAALVLKKWKGMSGQEAIDLLRERRSSLALANDTFARYVLEG